MTLRLGLVGHGRWGRNIERTLRSFADVSLDIIGKEAPPPSDLDGVIIANQSALHVQTALPYVAAGIPTFIEKPLATTIADAERVQEAAIRSKTIIHVGHIFLRHPAFIAALRLLPGLGPVRYALCEGMNNAPRTDSSVLWDHLPHDLSMARAIFGRDPDQIQAWHLAGATLPQAALAIFRYADTPLVSSVSWLSPVPKRRLTVVCQEATLVFDDKAQQRLLIRGEDGTTSAPDYSQDLPLTIEMHAFLEAIRSGRAEMAQCDLGVAIVRTIAAAEQSMLGEGERLSLKPAAGGQ
jgi:predicted dehydrogenase